MVRVSMDEINYDDDGFPKSNEFYFPILEILGDNSFTEEEINEELIGYFNLSEEQINQKVNPRNDDDNPKTKLESRAHFAIADFERLNFIKKENKKYFIQDNGKYIIKKNIFKLNKTSLVKIKGKLDLVDVLSSLSNLKLDMTFLHLTKTGITHNNIDATEHIRSFLKRNNLFDYESIENGEEDKEYILSYFFTEEYECSFKTSLYRANSRGDPRIGLTELNKDILKEGSIFLIVTDNEKLYFLNLSDKNIRNSILNKTGRPYEILKKVSCKDNEQVLFNFFKKINQRRYILLNEDNPSIRHILEKEDVICVDDSNEFNFKDINFKVFEQEYDFEENSEIVLVDSMPIVREDFNFLRFKQNYFSDENIFKISNKNINNKLKLEFDYLNGNLKVIEAETKENIFIWNLESILLSMDDKFYIIYKNIHVPKGHYVIFDKLLQVSNVNFSLLSFFMLDKDIESNLGIDIELSLCIEIDEDFQNFTLKLKITDNEIINKLFNHQINL